jgi:hypothetical protein
MSVSLSIKWSNGEAEDIAISSLKGAKAWAEIGRSLGLKLVPQFYSFLPVEPDQLDALIHEVKIFCDEIKGRGTGYEEIVNTTTKLLDAFERLKHSSDWHATIG